MKPNDRPKDIKDINNLKDRNNRKMLTPLSTSTRMTQSTAFITSMPDDLSFVTNQIKKVDKRNFLLHYNQLKPWEKTGNPNKYSSSGKSNYEVLKEFKIRNANKKTDLKEIDWSNQDYFDENKLDDILDANAIKKRVLSKSECKEPYIDIHTYASQNKQICVKNILIDLMQNERMKILQKEHKRENALINYDNDLNNDQHIFENYKRSLVTNLKQQEDQLNGLINQNKVLLEHKKKLTQENRLTLEEIEKAIRKILAMKQYAEFVSSVLSKHPISFPKTVEMMSTVNTGNNREKDLEIYTHQILEGYNCILDANRTTSDSYLDDPLALQNVFTQIEENILKLMNEKEDYEKELLQTKKGEDTLLKQKQDRLNELDEIVERMKKERDDLKKELNRVYCIENNEEVKLNDKFIREIDKDISNMNNISLKSLYYVPKTVDIIDRLYKNVDHIDEQINFLINTISGFEDKELLDELIKKRKEYNLEVRHELDKIAKQEAEKIRKARIERKANSIVILGKNRYGDPIPPNIVRKKRELEHAVKIENIDDTEMLYY